MPQPLALERSIRLAITDGDVRQTIRFRKSSHCAGQRIIIAGAHQNELFKGLEVDTVLSLGYVELAALLSYGIAPQHQAAVCRHLCRHPPASYPLIVLASNKVIQKSEPCPAMEQIKTAKPSNPELSDRYLHGLEYQQCQQEIKKDFSFHIVLSGFMLRWPRISPPGSLDLSQWHALDDNVAKSTVEQLLGKPLEGNGGTLADATAQILITVEKHSC